jgi:cis-L-3-hydroxyproline dehydratase
VVLPFCLKKGMASLNLLESERTQMNLNGIQKSILDGERGQAPQKAMELIVRYAGVLGAERLCRVSWADLFCGAHHYLDVAGSDDFDRVFSTMSLCTTQTAELKQMDRGCICYSGVEVDCTEVPEKMLVGPDRQTKNLAMLSRFVNSGVVLSGSCVPYLLGFVPLAGEHFVSCESSAVLFLNSLWGACGNGDGIEASFCAAVCGYTPLWGRHLPENRKATHVVEIQSRPESIHDWDVLGHTVGMRLPPMAVPVITGGYSRPDAIRLKAFFASLACAAGTEMCHLEGITPEAATIQQALGDNPDQACIPVSTVDVAESVEALNGHDRQPIDYISLGCPHYHIDEIRRIAAFLDGRRIHPDTLVHVWTAGPFKYMADRCGYTRSIENAGAHLLTGSCPSTRGYPAGMRTAAYDAAKQRMSAAQETDARLFYGSVEQCLQTAISGIWEGH